MKVAIVAASGLGDGLLSLILAQNFLQKFSDVSVVSSPLCQLRNWFPSVKIIPYPLELEKQALFSSFDWIIAADHGGITPMDCFGNNLTCLSESAFNKQYSMADNLALVAQKLLGIPCQKNLSFQPPDHLILKKHEKRVVIHPESSNLGKNWSYEKFISLSLKLQDLGYQPFFCVSPKERPFWDRHLSKYSIDLPTFTTLHETAQWVYESRYFIGNDSGIGHLASAFSIPTLSIFARKSYSRLWRPDWGFNQVITPLEILPGAYLKKRLWKNLLGVNRVIGAFNEMVARSNC